MSGLYLQVFFFRVANVGLRRENELCRVSRGVQVIFLSGLCSCETNEESRCSQLFLFHGGYSMLQGRRTYAFYYVHYVYGSRLLRHFPCSVSANCPGAYRVYQVGENCGLHLVLRYVTSYEGRVLLFLNVLQTSGSALLAMGALAFCSPNLVVVGACHLSQTIPSAFMAVFAASFFGLGS